MKYARRSSSTTSGTGNKCQGFTTVVPRALLIRRFEMYTSQGYRDTRSSRTPLHSIPFLLRLERELESSRRCIRLSLEIDYREEFVERHRHRFDHGILLRRVKRLGFIQSGRMPKGKCKKSWLVNFTECIPTVRINSAKEEKKSYWLQGHRRACYVSCNLFYLKKTNENYKIQASVWHSLY